MTEAANQFSHAEILAVMQANFCSYHKAVSILVRREHDNRANETAIRNYQPGKFYDAAEKKK